jgi:aryl-alcohol dehydrogenase-like predicted oxidoreductase
MTHVALAWILRNVTSPIIGFCSVERIDTALGVRGKTLSDDEVRWLEELYEVRPVQGHS